MLRSTPRGTAFGKEFAAGNSLICSGSFDGELQQSTNNECILAVRGCSMVREKCLD